MCYMIILGISKDLEKSQLSFLDNRVSLNPIEFRELKLKYPHSKFYTLTSGGCSCDLFSPLKSEKGLRKKFRKKGLSKERVEKKIFKIRQSAMKDKGLDRGLALSISTFAREGYYPIIFIYWTSDAIPEEPETTMIRADDLRDFPGLLKELKIYEVIV